METGRTIQALLIISFTMICLVMQVIQDGIAILLNLWDMKISAVRPFSIIFTGSAKPGTYAEISCKWKAGDVIELNLPMPVRLMEANPKVEDLHNKVAVMRGPLVYCLELPKREGGEKTWNGGVFLPENIVLTPEHRREFLGGVTVLKGKALTRKRRAEFTEETAGAASPATQDRWNGLLYRPLRPRSLKQPQHGIVDITLIPYYAWANRGLAMMEVWIPLARAKYNQKNRN